MRWQTLTGNAAPSKSWGMNNVTDAEVDSILRRDAVLPNDPHGLYQQNIRNEIALLEQRAREAAQQIEQRVHETEVELRLLTLLNRLGLSPLELDIVLVCLWSELDERYRRTFGYLMDDATRRTPSVHLITQILTPLLTDQGRVQLDEMRAALEPESPLLRWRVVTLTPADKGAATFGLTSVKLDDRIVAYLLDEDTPDARLSDALTVLPITTYADPWQAVRQDEPVRRILSQLETWLKARRNSGRSATLLLHGSYGSGRLQTAQALTRAIDPQLRLVRVDAAAALRSTLGWDELVARVYREAALRNLAPVYWAGCEALLDDAARWQALTRAAEAYDSVTFLESTRTWTPVGGFRASESGLAHGQAFAQVEFPTPSYELRVQLWREGLARVPEFRIPANEADSLVRSLSTSFQFTEGQIADAITAARAIALTRNAQAPSLQQDDLYEGCRMQSSGDLQMLAQRIEPRKNLTPDDLVLPPTTRRQFEELRARVRYRSDLQMMGFGERFQLGRGLIALFTGSSGTGKTMGAELLAQSMGVAIYRVDMSAVVSKYVGETEKNVNRVFQLAEGTGAILFFDEADALFGKRGEVKDAQDRWANLEVNYLLQRVEQYSGVVILASNLRQNIDDAFARRIHVLIDFPFPDEVHRLEIWERAMQARDDSLSVLRFPDAEYHARFTPDYCALLETKIRAILQEANPDLTVAELERQVQRALMELTRDEIRALLDPELARLAQDDPEAFSALLQQENDLLARRFQLAGGNIRNVVVDATVRALSEYDQRNRNRHGDPPGGDRYIRLRHLNAGIVREYQKLGKPVTRGDFGDPFYDWAKQDGLL
ncbi:MAG: ATP-binding protein [Anaerolineae bacterium]